MIIEKGFFDDFINNYDEAYKKEMTKANIRGGFLDTLIQKAMTPEPETTTNE